MNEAGAAEAFEALQADDPAVVAGYRLAARLGAGGMGRVYLSHTAGGRPVAIKVVRPELADDPDFRRRFRREIKAAQRVRGAYTAELIDADADGVPPWLATLYVPGPSLSEAVARRGPLPVPAVLWLVAGVAEALQAIHGAGIVHRDLKPSNVLLAADGPRVIDFGISLAADSTSYTATGSAIGTPSFMAPEQASGGEVTAATDVFALGQTAAFAALGEPLYGEGAAVNILYRIVHSEPDLSRLPSELRPLIARCLAADPGERATPGEVVEWCREWLGRGADAGAGPTVWREVMGAEVTVPGPVAGPVPALAPGVGSTPTPTRTLPMGEGAAEAGVSEEVASGGPQLQGPSAGWMAPSAVVPSGVVPSGVVPSAVAPSGAAAGGMAADRPYPVGPVPVGAYPMGPYPMGPYPAGPYTVAPEERQARRRRAVLIVVGIVSAGVLLMAGLAWLLKDAMDGIRDRDTASSSTAGATGGGGSSASSSSGSGAKSGSGSAAGSGGGTGSSSGGSASPEALPYPFRWIDEKNSLNLREPIEPKNAKGDIRLDCKDAGCALDSRTSVITQLTGRPGATYDTCRTALTGVKSHSLGLAWAAKGSEICVRNRSGDIALLVIQVKSTALWDTPGMSFVTADMTVWRAP
ncbi:protein kinase domain-containing protein [Streptomyces sp. CA-249302]|uniref:serine/threonine-protein kinase n=1 Tax=Streptomyces sp. CA-249302 TaxID=3240058 RepID=UPI003D89C6A1